MNEPLTSVVPPGDAVLSVAGLTVGYRGRPVLPPITWRLGRGEVWALHLGWSGNHEAFVDHLPSGHTVLGAGELLEPGEIVLEPTGPGTRIRWTISFTPAVPGAQFAISAGIRTTAKALAKEVTKRGGAGRS